MRGPISAAPSEGQERGSPERDARVAELLRRHFTAVWRLVRRLGVPSDLADDATQEVFIVVARKLDTLIVGGELRFLRGVALRVAANARRACFTRREQGDEHALEAAIAELPSAEALLDEKRRRELLDVALDELAPDLREVFVLSELEGLLAREIAELLEVPMGTVASRLRRARTAFYECAARLKVALGEASSRSGS